MNNMVIGLTGQTGAGKTTVSDYLRENGVTVIDADQVARRVVEQGSACIADIALEFGCEYINMDGTLNRRKMARTVFGDKAKLKKLNSLMFPYIIEEIRGELARLKEEQGGLIVLDAPTLFESGADKECDYVVSVTAAAPERERRIIARDGLSQEEARERIAAQHDEDYYKSRSWRVLENNGSADSLKNEVSALLATLEGMMEQPASAPDKEDILQTETEEKRGSQKKSCKKMECEVGPAVGCTGSGAGGGGICRAGTGHPNHLSSAVSPQLPQLCRAVQPGIRCGRKFSLCGGEGGEQL